MAHMMPVMGGLSACANTERCVRPADVSISLPSVTVPVLGTEFPRLSWRNGGPWVQAKCQRSRLHATKRWDGPFQWCPTALSLSESPQRMRPLMGSHPP